MLTRGIFFLFVCRVLRKRQINHLNFNAHTQSSIF